MRAHRPTRIAAPLIGIALGLLAPTSAMAALTAVDVDCKGRGSGNCTVKAVFTGQAGEVNDVTVTGASGDRVSFADQNNPVVPGAGCEARGLRRVVCDPRSLGRGGKTTVAAALVQTRDRDDAVVTFTRSRVRGGLDDDFLTTRAAVRTFLAGGPGTDRVVSESSVGQTLGGNDGSDKVIGGDGEDTARGNDGEDVVLGGADDDLLSGNAGNDQVLGGTGRDLMFGRTGHDRLFGNGGRDRLRGNSGSDGLAGGRGSDGIAGGTGRDRLFGNSGNDRLHGNAGRDRYRGGSGNDRIRSVDDIGERVNCGTGFDFAVVDRKDILAACNAVDRR